MPQLCYFTLSNARQFYSLGGLPLKPWVSMNKDTQNVDSAKLKNSNRHQNAVAVVCLVDVLNIIRGVNASHKQGLF